VLVAVVGAPGAAGAATDPSDEGLWYATQSSIPAVHEITRGAGMTIAVIDGSVNPAVPDLAGTNLVVRDQGFCQNADGTPTSGTSTTHDAEHATGIVSMLIGTGLGIGDQRGVIGIVPEATVLAYNASADGWADAQAADADYPPCLVDGVDNPDAAWALAIEQAIDDGADIISFSMNAELPCMEAMGEAILHAHQAGVIVVAGTSNDREEMLGCPAGANGVISVEIVDWDGNLVDPSMEDPYLTILGPGKGIRGLSWSDGAWDRYGVTTGSSVATPFVAGALALAWSVHPEATANQMIQAMLRNTGAQPDHGLVRNDQHGFGTIATLTMVQSDPTAYPDENPLLHPYGDDVLPLTADILGTATQTPTPQPTQTAATTPKPTDEPTPATEADEGGGSNLGLLIGGGALLLIVVVTVVIIVIRRGRTTPGATDTTPTSPTSHP